MRLYEFIVRHFLACVSKDALGKETTVNIDINGEKVRTMDLEPEIHFIKTSFIKFWVVRLNDNNTKSVKSPKRGDL